MPPSLRDNATRAFTLLREGRAHLGGEGREMGNSDETESISSKGDLVLTVAQENAKKKAQFDYYCEDHYWTGSHPREMSFKDLVRNRVDRQWSVCEELLGEREWSVWRDKVISQFDLMGGRTENEKAWLGLSGWGWEYRISSPDNATTTTKEDAKQMKNEWFGWGGTLQRVSVWDKCDEMSFLVPSNKKDPKTGKINGIIERSVVDEGYQWYNEEGMWKIKLIGEKLYDMRYFYLFRGVVLMVLGWWLWKKWRARGKGRRNQGTEAVSRPEMVECLKRQDKRDGSDARSPYERPIYESEDTNSENTNSENTNSENTNSENTNSEDTNFEDINSEDTNSEDINSEDINSENTNSEDTNSEDTNSEDTNSNKFQRQQFRRD
ncbi:hypothetical protein BELL_0968g00040 [Botrytis elliptica]|uniref:Uncharacterized protein n=1 Tax=Botrytis elliptica TaxID=278938 RepID=A0A4Z1JBG9_9HELO|nr:hypothetical protein EAE99_011603 [Botrytis elliptica]TGO66307.1 hypothetical protein BELL_0968g00040 [Botrytis elliptica]